MMVGDSLLSAMASGDEGGQVRMLEMLGNGFNEAKRYAEALAFFERAIKTSESTPDAGFPYMAYEGSQLPWPVRARFRKPETSWSRH